MMRALTPGLARHAACSTLFCALLLSLLPLSTGVQAAGVPAASDTEDKRERPPVTFTLNRVRLYVISAQRGEPWIFLPPLNGHHPRDVVNEANADASRAIEIVRTKYSFEKLEIVSQSYYLLQAVRVRGGQYTYQLNPEPGWGPYSNDSWDGSLEVDTENGDLEFRMDISRDQEEVFLIQMAVDPGRPIACGKQISDDNAVFAVLTFDTPDSSPYISGNGSTAPVMSKFGPDATGEGSTVPSPRIYLNWDTPPTLTHYSPADYPEIARRAGVEGFVTFHVVIGTDGTVEQVKVAEQVPANRHRIFEKAAEAAVLQWQYRPATINCIPVRALVSQTVQFVLSEDGWSHY